MSSPAIGDLEDLRRLVSTSYIKLMVGSPIEDVLGDLLAASKLALELAGIAPEEVERQTLHAALEHYLEPPALIASEARHVRAR